MRVTSVVVAAAEVEAAGNKEMGREEVGSRAAEETWVGNRLQLVGAGSKCPKVVAVGNRVAAEVVAAGNREAEVAAGSQEPHLGEPAGVGSKEEEAAATPGARKSS